jgi:predicted transcriptional regulator
MDFNHTGENNMQTESIKQVAYRLLDNLPEQATWDDLMYRIYVRQAIEAGLKDSDAGRTVDVMEVRKKFGLNK